MKGIIGTPMYLTKLFPKNLSNKIKDIPLTDIKNQQILVMKCDKIFLV